MGQATSNTPPIGRGEFNPLPSGVSTTDEFGVDILGSEWEFDDLDWTNATPGPKPVRTGQKVRVRLVRNDSNAAILPCQCVAISPTNPGSATALSSSVSLEAYPADEFLPAAGVPVSGLFWVVVRGTAKMIWAATVTANVTAGDFINPSAVTNGAIDIVNTFTANKALFEAIKGARFKATVDGVAATIQGTKALLEVFP
jgi:hypothetical protein